MAGTFDKVYKATIKTPKWDAEKGGYEEVEVVFLRYNDPEGVDTGIYIVHDHLVYMLGKGSASIGKVVSTKVCGMGMAVKHEEDFNGVSQDREVAIPNWIWDLQGTTYHLPGRPSWMNQGHNNIWDLREVDRTLRAMTPEKRKKSFEKLATLFGASITTDVMQEIFEGLCKVARKWDRYVESEVVVRVYEDDVEDQEDEEEEEISFEEPTPELKRKREPEPEQEPINDDTVARKSLPSPPEPMDEDEDDEEEDEDEEDNPTELVVGFAKCAGCHDKFRLDQLPEDTLFGDQYGVQYVLGCDSHRVHSLEPLYTLADVRHAQKEMALLRPELKRLRAEKEHLTQEVANLTSELVMTKCEIGGYIPDPWTEREAYKLYQQKKVAKESADNFDALFMK